MTLCMHNKSGDNLYIRPNGRKDCRQCRTRQKTAWYHKNLVREREKGRQRAQERKRLCVVCNKNKTSRALCLPCARTTHRTYQERRIKEFSEIEAAWIGALIEGEGSVGSDGRDHMKVTVTNTDPEVLSAFLRVLGTGHIYPHHKNRTRNNHTKPCYTWQISRRVDILYLVQRCFHYSTKLQRLQPVVERQVRKAEMSLRLKTRGIIRCGRR